jgi:threonine dehydrogenase-like Zn-dependent dehydrogenase
MKALTFHGPQHVVVETIPDPELVAPGDVLVRVEMAGICGSDLHPYLGREKGLDAGTVMGHEAVAVVVEIGAEVRGLRRGDRIFSPFTTSCGQCFYCRAGLTCRCVEGQLYGFRENGRGLHGLQAQYARVPLADTTLMRVPDGIAPEEALLLGDVLSTGFFGAEIAGVRPSTACAVIGCGPVGLMGIVAARELGAATILAVDPVPERRMLATRFGAVAVDPALAEEAIRAATDGRGADAIIEAVGSAAAARLAYDLVRPGGTIAVAGVHTEPGFPFTPAEAYAKNLTYRVDRCPARHYMEKLVPLVQSRRYDFIPLFSHCFSLADGPEGYRRFASRQEGCTKVVLVP